MLGVSAVDPATRLGGALTLDAEAAPSGFGLTHQWGFASDARAALIVWLHSADILVLSGSGVLSYVIRYRSFSIQPSYLAHIVIGCVVFSLILQIAGLFRFAALRHHREH